MPRHFLSVLSEEGPARFSKGSGRLQLADAIAAHPLTSRVLVNLVWRWHFGTGIVDTPSNFGRIGDRPSHPELLEHLARGFEDSGRSIKALHREIMLTDAYQRSTEHSQQNYAKDPGNRLYWRANRRRLDAEAIRDTLLFVSGTLDAEVGGPSLELADAKNDRRTVYSRVSRVRLDDYLQTFDFANPSLTVGKRFATTVPQQSLYFMNSDFVRRQAKNLTGRLEGETPSGVEAESAPEPDRSDDRKIVATLGPATKTRERITDLIEAGMDVARLNFSHGTHEDHAERIAMVREAAAAGRGVAILQDLQGPKIRTGRLAGGRPVRLVAGATFSITTEEIRGDATRVSTTYDALPGDIRPGDRILLSDGAISLRAIRTSATEVTTEVVCGGSLSERQGINLPGIDISIRGVTDKDLADLRFGLQQNVDIVAISFVRSADEVRLVKRHIEEAGADIPVIAKLEKPEAIDVLDEIIDAADGVMVARGDLDVELAPEKVPLLQKRIIAAANQRAKPVITVAQMLESMVRNPRPTRAEASDVANAILDGSDAIMLSGETAVGDYPVEAIATMSRIAAEMQAGVPATAPPAIGVPSASRTRPEAIAAAVGAMVESLPESARYGCSRSLDQPHG